MKKQLLVAFLFILSISDSFALGLGEIELRSSLTEPLDASIEVMYSAPDEVNSARVRLASAEEFAKAGLPRPFVLSQLRFRMKQRADGSHYIQVTSSKSLHEPYLEFVIKLDSARYGSIMKSYAILLDPPSYTPPELSQAEPVIEVPSQQPEAQFYGPIKRSETLWVIADKLRADKSVSVEQMMIALQQANPDAFIDNNINRLKQKSMLRVPSKAEATQLTRKQARNEFMSQVEAWKAGKRPKPRQPAQQPAPAPALPIEKRPAPVPAPVPVPVPVPEQQTTAPEPEAKPEQPQTSEPEGAVLKVEETDASQIPDIVGDEENPDYPTDPRVKLKSQIADSEQELKAINEINKDLDELKTTLEDKLTALRELLDERDEVIESLKQQVEAKEAKEAQQVKQAIVEATQPAPAPVVEPVTPEEEKLVTLEAPLPPLQKPEPTFISKLASDPVTIVWTLVGFLLVILLSVLIFRPRYSEQKVPVVVQYESDPTNGRASGQENNDQRASRYPPAPEIDTRSFIPETGASMGFNGDEKATNFVKAAIEQNPQDAALKVILLEMYAIAGDEANFGSHLEQYHQEIKQNAPDYWTRVVEIGSTMSRVHPLIAKALS